MYAFTRLWRFFIYECFRSVCEINWHPLPWHFEIYFKLQNTYTYTYTYTFIYKAILGLLLFYFAIFIAQKCGGYSLRSLDFILLTVPNVRTEFGKRAYMYSAPSSWNALQNTCKFEELVPMGVFKSLMKDFEADSLTCQCF